MRHDDTIENRRALASGQGADLAAFYDRRAAAALAYCSRLCAPDAIADAVEASFARVFEGAATGDAPDGDALDRSLRSAVRSESASRASVATAGMPARRLLERLADPSRGGACELMPALLAARADGQLTEGDRERMSVHLRRCAECRTAEHRFNEAEAAFDALAGDHAPALGRSLLAEMLADAPLSDQRRFARERLASEPSGWLEEIDWHDEEKKREPRVVQVPADALEPAVAAAAEEDPPDAEVVEHDEPAAARDEAAEAESDAADTEGSAARAESDRAEAKDDDPDAPPWRGYTPAQQRAPADEEAQEDPPWRSFRPARKPAVTTVATEDFPIVEPPDEPRGPRLGRRARKRIAITMLVLGVLLIAEAALTVLWKEPFTAFIAARAQDDLTGQLHKLDSQRLSAGEQTRLASIRGAQQRTDARIAALAAQERRTVGQGDALGTLSIRKIGIDYVIVQGTDPASLRTGPAHYLETPLPGQGGTMGIAGHRTTYEAPFRHIDDLKAGDTISLKMPYGLFTYSVDRRRIVPADYKDAFASPAASGGAAAGAAGSTAQGGEWLVLSACHPLYSASERILVYARLISRRPLGAAIERSVPAPTSPTVSRALARARTAKRLAAMGTRNLGPGMTGSDVKEVQRLLGVPATGTYGADTAAAVTAFQQAHNLPPVGRVGSLTKAALARRSHPPLRPPKPAPVQQQPPQTSGPGQSGAQGSQRPGSTGTQAPGSGR